VYTYSVPPGGYAPNGNLLAHSDSVMGDWAFQYDTLNRLTVMAPSNNAPSADSISLGCYAYDAFGNRTLDVLTHSADDLCSSHPASEYSSYTTHNQTATVYEVTDSGGTDSVTSVPLTYDAAGNVTSDGSNAYVYDAEGHLCAMENLLATTVTAYYYDAGGTRVAKGTPASATLPLSSQACNPAANGFTLTNEYLLDQAGNQVTELNNQVTGTAAMGWAHSNVWSGAHLNATYDVVDECNQTTGVCTWTPALHFHLSDPLGTRRVQIAPYGTTTYGMIEGFFQSLPYGDTLAVDLWDPNSGYTLPSADDATENHFTGKERDTESGNDYFEARYYSSAMGRFMSPDWTAKEEGDDPVPYSKLENPQTLNLYQYGLNNPLGRTDPDGHMSTDTYEPDRFNHGAPHIDRSTKDGHLVGRYNPDGTPIEHKGKTPPPIPKADRGKFQDAVDKLHYQEDVDNRPGVPKIPIPDGLKPKPDPTPNPLPIPVPPPSPSPGPNPSPAPTPTPLPGPSPEPLPLPEPIPFPFPAADHVSNLQP